MTKYLSQLALVVFMATANAQSYPSKPIHLIVPFPPGGPTDIVGRMVAQKISEGVGQSVVVENRPGAGGTVGSSAAAKAAPDGYMLLYGSTSTLAIAPSLYRSIAYDPRKSFAPISLVSSGPILITVNEKVPARALAITGATRSPALPDVPTVAEAGLPKYDANFWSGLVAPAGTPADIITRLNGVLVKALGTPEQFAAHIAAEVEKWAAVVKTSGAKID